MTDVTILVQYTVTQREERPSGFRIWSDGRVQRAAESNPLPTPTERLDVERQIEWADVRTLDAAQLEKARLALRTANFAEMPPKLLINYCKEDPGAGLWIVNVDGQSGRVVVYDPRPKRNAALDTLLSEISSYVN